MRKFRPIFALMFVLSLGCDTPFEPETFSYACQNDSDCVQGYVCFTASSRPNAQPLCVREELAQCEVGYADCDSDRRCEVNVLEDPAHCGGCGNTCASGVCEAGDCGCAVAECDGVCVDTNVSTEHCGQCGNACDADTETCLAGACVCKAGWKDCVTSIDGCETSLRLPENCGECGNVCTLDVELNNDPTCEAEMCQEACWPGFGKCTTSPDEEGCETDFLSDAKHCGECGKACARDVCVAGQCLFSFAYRKMVAGDQFTCTLRANSTPNGPNGVLRCAGTNERGQLGLDIAIEKTWEPTEVPGLGQEQQAVPRIDTELTDLDAGPNHVCVVKGGQVWCWGAVTSGMFGAKRAPDDFPNAVICHTIAAGASVYCVQATPVHEEILNDVVRVAVGQNHVCVIRRGGSVWCWGNVSAIGPVPPSEGGALVEVPNIRGAVEIAAGDRHTCVRTAYGQVWCWGDNDFGQLGTGSNFSTDSVPHPIEFPMADSLNGYYSYVIDVDAYGNNTCVVAAAEDNPTIGIVFCWGDNAHGQLTVDPENLEFSNAPVRTTPANWTDLVAVSVGRRHNCIMDDKVPAALVLCVGDDTDGQLGDGGWPPTSRSSYSAEKRVNDLEPDHPILSLSTGGDAHTCIVPSNSTRIRCWGDNASGQLARNPENHGSNSWKSNPPTPYPF